jgi:hypothetical protein
MNMRIKEITTIKARTPEQARLDALKSNADRAKQAVKAERERQRVQKAQQRLQTLTTV